MLHNTFARVLSKVHSYRVQVRYSALFINGTKATDTYVYVHPHIEFTDKVKNRDLILKEIEKRKYAYDLDKLFNLWSVYEELNQRKLDYVNKKAEISMELGKIMKSSTESEEVKPLKIKIDLIKENLKKLKVPLWSAEEAAILEYLKLPNRLHSLTPGDNKKVLYSHMNKPSTDKNHLQVAKEKNLLDFKKNENYYLRGDAAIFELGAKFQISKKLKECNFIQFSNPDFVKSVIVEGCGTDHTDPDASFIIHHTEDSKVNIDSRLHLTGAGSLCSFMAYYSKNVLPAKYLPLKYFSMGRQYVPATAEEDSLFHVSQSTVVQMFCATKGSEEQEKVFNEVVTILKDVYNNFGCHYRIVLAPAHKLLMWESLRLSVEMYSSSLADYVEVGNLSLSGDFISKRLMLTYVDKKDSIFPHIMSGTIINVPKLLACYMEQDFEFKIPKVCQVDNWLV